MHIFTQDKRLHHDHHQLMKDKTSPKKEPEHSSVAALSRTEDQTSLHSRTRSLCIFEQTASSCYVGYGVSSINNIRVSN